MDVYIALYARITIGIYASMGFYMPTRPHVSACLVVADLQWISLLRLKIIKRPIRFLSLILKLLSCLLSAETCTPSYGITVHKEDGMINIVQNNTL